MRSHFFVSNKETGLTYLYVYNEGLNKEVLEKHQAQAKGDTKSYFQLDPVKTKLHDKYVYYPKKFETLSMIEIEEYRKSVNWRFYKYYFMNKSNILKQDHKAIGVKLNSFYFGFALTAGIGYFSNNLFKKIDVPFFTEGGFFSKIQTSKLRYAATTVIVAKLLHQNYVGFLKDKSIYDIALGYKQNF